MKKLITLTLLGLFSLAAKAQTVALTLTTPPCHADGVLTTTVTGLTPPFTVDYSMPSGTVSHTVTSGTTDILTAYAGSYVSVHAYNSASGAYTSFAGQPPFTDSVSTTAAYCPGVGSAMASVSGGTAPYSYQWKDASTGIVVSTSNPASLPGGAYRLMITDAAGCTYGSIYSGDSIYVSSIAPFSYSITTTTANCTNGTATVGAVTGGLAPYSYLWSTMAATASISGLSMGSYNCTVTDANGCSMTQYAYVNQSISISAPVTSTPATCVASNGAVIAFGSGGVPPYTYLWSNGATTQSQTGLSSGSYNVHVTDANGCIGSGYGYVNASSPITATYTATSSLCTSPTGSATLTLAGGTAPYSVMWYTTPPQTGVTATALAPGNYSFHITDAAGCVRTGTAVVPPVDVINLAFTTSTATCTLPNGSVSVAPTGGVAPLTYSWNTGGSTAALTGVTAGSYHVTVTDANGCAVTGWGYVPVYSPLAVSTSATATSCLFINDGSIIASAYGGTLPYTYNWSNGATTSTVSSLASGSYYVHVSDASGCTANRYTFLPQGNTDSSCYCTIKGVVFHDLNGNCTQDPGEPGIEGIQMHCSGMGYTYTNASGFYSFKVPTGSYTISENVATFYPLSACQSNNIPVSVTASAGCSNVVNFSNSMNTIHDVHISTWDYNLPIPGHTYSQATIITNEGTVPEATVVAGYKTDGQLFAPSFVPAGIFTGASNYYNSGTGITSLNPGISSSFLENYNVPTNIPLGTSVVFQDSAVVAAPMTTWTSDYTPWNNVNYFNTVVVSSYDPNFKEVNPKGTGPQGYIPASDSVLEYMVHFQNTGTYFAEKVVVIDTLDPNLDWKTLHPVYESHQCSITMDDNGVAKFTFNNINLPASASQPVTSNGMFTYTVKLRHGLAVGTQIKNRASIYFDYNEPVMTNGTLNTIKNTVGIANAVDENASFSVYPNPADKTCFAVINSDVLGNADLLITDITGKTLLNKTVSLVPGKQNVPVDITALSPGMYFVSLHNMGKVETQKLVIIK